MNGKLKTISDNTNVPEEGEGRAAAAIPTLRTCIKQPVFITHCIWFFFLQLKFVYFVGTLNLYLNRSLGGDKELGNMVLGKKSQEKNVTEKVTQKRSQEKKSHTKKEGIYIIYIFLYICQLK